MPLPTASYDNITLNHHGTWNQHPYNLRQALEHFERNYLYNILVLVEWDQPQAAKMLGIHQKTLENKLQKYDLTPSSLVLTER